jgi:hypothetical protein
MVKTMAGVSSAKRHVWDLASTFENLIGFISLVF